ncbi:hypothetical protein B0T20DRAFT_104325 [Sordaria brevicollis]|uniref:Uncharacterized protein n=1 Tax=Sordaria brevicollis TaxID=83679 RepID=A0AAE0NVU8_SORBR|nr:hypothetical protein B0T20DRAFT_104325 [Sordaria brevicollis]
MWYLCGLPVMELYKTFPPSSNTHPSHFGRMTKVARHFGRVTKVARHFGRVNKVERAAVAPNLQDILRSLLWEDCWETVTTALSSQQTEHGGQSRLRREGFPSWTWAGWKTVQDYRLHIQPPLQSFGPISTCYMLDGFTFGLRLSFAGRLLSFLDDVQEIRNCSMVIGQFPDFLVITGPVFDVCIADQYSKGWHSPTTRSKPNVWEYTSPAFLAGKEKYTRKMKYCGPPFSQQEVGGDTIQLIAVCFFCGWAWQEEKDLRIWVLMLRPVGEDVHGKIYERVTCTVFDSDYFDPDFSPADMNLRQMELRIR